MACKGYKLITQRQSVSKVLPQIRARGAALIQFLDFVQHHILTWWNFSRISLPISDSTSSNDILQYVELKVSNMNIEGHWTQS